MQGVFNIGLTPFAGRGPSNFFGGRIDTKKVPHLVVGAFFVFFVFLFFRRFCVRNGREEGVGGSLPALADAHAGIHAVPPVGAPLVDDGVRLKGGTPFLGVGLVQLV